MSRFLFLKTGHILRLTQSHTKDALSSFFSMTGDPNLLIMFHLFLFWSLLDIDWKIACQKRNLQLGKTPCANWREKHPSISCAPSMILRSWKKPEGEKGWISLFWKICAYAPENSHQFGEAFITEARLSSQEFDQNDRPFIIQTSAHITFSFFKFF